VRIEEMHRRIAELKDQLEGPPAEGPAAAAGSERGAAEEERRGSTGVRIVASEVEWLDRRADEIRGELETLRTKLDRLEREVGAVAGPPAGR
jgi:predicted nuclease with TOPRIM domain